MENRIRRQFNRSANVYDSHAHVQRRMAEWLAGSLEGLRNNIGSAKPDLLEIGCGTGALTERLLRDYPDASLLAMDIAPAMVEEARKRTRSVLAGRSDNQPRFILADVEKWAATATAASQNMIVSNACFQWMGNPAETLSRLGTVLRPGGLLLFTTFGPQTFRELHRSFEYAYLAAGREPQRHGLSFPPADRWQSMLREAGFQAITVERTVHSQSYRSAKDFLHAVKAAGASASEASDGPGLGSRHLFDAMFAYYEDRYGIPEGVQATYELYLIAASVP
ncbi:malonyl-ACP O-methyltransferase BioC [Paenibacillus sp. LHD-117]|uniref:malonyl-ACP O-methyltransferase BioC n=1 Tax=Paenibacillus sp. LHD-117 TaxID=3071412 RepID=UPI0027E11C8B|nr:malonyl-ACP O-methyltransferase BioC [Paenibacillus sp. LHD-117]MDQ6419615.1 malonyl-ACP O-methyltransferase BioC [Paenibacillus sp. LHD-117]